LAKIPCTRSWFILFMISHFSALDLVHSLSGLCIFLPCLSTLILSTLPIICAHLVVLFYYEDGSHGLVFELRTSSVLCLASDI